MPPSQHRGHIAALTLTIILSSAGLSGASEVEPTAAEKMYRCDHGTPLFTNKTSYGCAEYEPLGALMIAPNELMFPQRAMESEKVSTVSRPVRSEIARSQACELYDEWITMNERTTGTFLYQTTEQTRRWYALARIFSGIGVPHHQCAQ
jgi:hypothetical protein